MEFRYSDRWPLMVICRLHPVLLVLFFVQWCAKATLCFQLCEVGIAAMEVNLVHRRHGVGIGSVVSQCLSECQSVTLCTFVLPF